MKRDLGPWIDGKLGMSQQRGLTTAWGGHQSQHFELLEEGDCPAATLPLCVSFRHLNINNDIKSLESDQKRVTKMVNGLNCNLYKEWQKLLDFFGLEKTEGGPHCSLQLP